MMKRYKKHTPEGFQDILFLECFRKRRLEDQCRNIFRTFGYVECETPLLEYLDVFEGEFVSSEAMYKCFDQKGRILVLRPDLTIPMARLVGSRVDMKKIPIRICYVDSVYRFNESAGKPKQIVQAGVEFIGLSTPEADAEIISVALETLISCGLEAFQIDIGQVDFFKGIVEEADLKESEIEDIRRYIDKKDIPGLEEYLDRICIDEHWKDILQQLPNLYGNFDSINQLREFVLPKRSRDALNNIESVYRILQNRGFEKYISLDLGMVTRLNYYTGIIFRGFTYGIGYPIVSGGRYDQLLGNFGTASPAVGCSHNITEILMALERQNRVAAFVEHSVLMTASQELKTEIYFMARKLRQKGMIVEEVYVDEGKEQFYKEARKKRVRHAIYLESIDKVEILNVTNNSLRILEMKEMDKWGM